jgi:hypothetical protein
MALHDTFPTAAPAGEPAPLRIRDPGDLVAAVPVLIGFHPRESLVLVATGGASGRRVGLTLRIDLPPPDHTAEVCERVAGSLLAGSPAGAAVIVVAQGPGGSSAPARPDVAAAAVAALEERGVDVHTVTWAAGTAAGGRWACYEPCGCSGRLPDPACTDMAVAAVAAGHVVYAGRDELEGLVAPTDTVRLNRRQRLLARAADRMRAGGEPSGPGRTAERLAGHRAVADAAIADAAAGRLELDDDRVVALAGALDEPAVRDALVLRCAGPRPGGTEQLWAALARETPDPHAAQPAALLAVSALLRGDGALANVALDRAEQAWPGHRLTTILRMAADAGIPPDRFRAMVLGGSTLGTRTGPDPARGR